MLRVCRPDVHQCDSGWVPVYADAQQNLALMSIGFLLEHPDEAVVWRGPKKTGVNSDTALIQHKTCSVLTLSLHKEYKSQSNSAVFLSKVVYLCPKSLT